MTEPSRSNRSRVVVLAIVLSLGFAASYRILRAPSPDDGSRSADATQAELNDSGAGPVPTPRSDAHALGPGATAASVANKGAQLDPEAAIGEIPPQVDRPPTPAAEGRGNDSRTANSRFDEAARLEESARHARSLGRLDDAANYLELALAIKEEQLAPDDPSIAETLGKLAGVYGEQGRDDEAMAAYLRAIDINQRSDSRTILAAAALSDLALLYRKQGNSEDALPLLESALDIELDVFGKEHPNVASRLAALGLLYRQQGLYDEAEPFLLDALLVRERIYSPNDPETTGAMTSLALLYREQGRYAEAEDLFLRALGIHENMNSPPRIALDLANLSVVYIANSQFSDAQSVFERALRIEDQNPWSPTAMVAQGINQLARSTQAAGNPDQAEEIYLWALDTSQRVLGDESPNTIFLRDQYVLYLRSLGRNDEADILAG